MSGGSARARSCVTVTTPAKINLFLSVRGVRPDGYHEIVTVLQTVALHDTLTCRIAGPPGQGHHPAARRGMRLGLVHDAGPAVPDDGDNLVLRAARRLGEHIRIVDPNGPRANGPSTEFELAKRIPVAGGMAGGSADAAAALVALNELWACNLDRDGLRGIAAEIGSDVPFCVVGGTGLATGTGVDFVRVLCRGTFHWVIACADEPLSTAAVYRTWDERCEPNEVEPDAVLAALSTQDPEALGAALHNDLQPAAEALRPELVGARHRLLDAGALGAIVSGSGPTLVALAADAGHAATIADRVRGDFHRVLVTTSPAGGPMLETCDGA